MSRKLISFALPLSFVLLFSAAGPSLAATPTTTFGVMATVVSGCSASASTFRGDYSAAKLNAVSSVSVSCTNTTQYVIAVSSLTAAGSGATVPIGNLSFPLASLMSYAVPSGSARNIKPNVMAVTGLAAGATDKTIAASNPNPDTISVSVIY